jgi:hypothetical protein
MTAQKMGPKDVNLRVLLATLAKMPDQFYTKELSNHADMLAAHPALTEHSHYHGFVGKRLAQEFDGRTLQRARSTSHPRKGMLWKKTAQGHPADPQVETAATVPAVTGDVREEQVVREGHWTALQYMADPIFREVKALFERYQQIGGVHFRPTDRGVTVVDLYRDSPRPGIGVGEDANLLPGTKASDIAPTMWGRIAHLERVRRHTRKPYQEERLEAYLIRDAQANQLCIPGFPERLRFINSQWAIHGAGGDQFPDLLAVDLVSHHLVLIELKVEPDPSAFDQVGSYLRFFQEHGDQLNPFFSRLGQVMGELYDCPELADLKAVKTAAAGLVAWPAGGQVSVQNLERLEELEPDDGKG